MADPRTAASIAARAQPRRTRLARAWRLVLPCTLAAGFALAGGCAAPGAARPDARLLRAELLALVQTFNADLLGHPSATLTLERWCADHRLADPARIVARRVQGPGKSLPQDLRAALELGPDDVVRYRHVQLVCGSRVLSDADNWYVATRLTDAMNEQLDTTDAPFGKVVAPLGFRRRTIAADLLWSPLPDGWENAPALAPAQAPQVPAYVLRHQAILYTSAQVPFSAVVETYTNQAFDFGRWSALLGGE